MFQFRIYRDDHVISSAYLWGFCGTPYK